MAGLLNKLINTTARKKSKAKADTTAEEKEAPVKRKLGAVKAKAAKSEASTEETSKPAKAAKKEKPAKKEAAKAKPAAKDSAKPASGSFYPAGTGKVLTSEDFKVLRSKLVNNDIRSVRSAVINGVVAESKTAWNKAAIKAAINNKMTEVSGGVKLTVDLDASADAVLKAARLAAGAQIDTEITEFKKVIDGGKLVTEAAISAAVKRAVKAGTPTIAGSAKAASPAAKKPAAKKAAAKKPAKRKA